MGTQARNALVRELIENGISNNLVTLTRLIERAEAEMNAETPITKDQTGQNEALPSWPAHAGYDRQAGDIHGR